MSFILLKQIINICKTSIKKLMLSVHCDEPIDGHHLEEIFKPCEKLEKLVFLFKYNHKKVDIDDCRLSFESEWWLDARRPPVYIQHNEIGGTVIASIPSHYSFIFKNDLYNWYVNKEIKIPRSFVLLIYKKFISPTMFISRLVLNICILLIAPLLHPINVYVSIFVI